MEQNKTILQILPALENGGVERGTIDVAKALKKEGFVPLVASAGGVLVYQLKEAGVEHIMLPLSSKNPLTIFLNIGRLVKIIYERKIDLVHVRSRAPMWSAYYACKKTGTKLISTVHGTYSLNFLQWENFLLKRIYNEIMLKADRIIAVSKFIKSYLLKKYPGDFSGKISVIQRGADLNYFNAAAVSKARMIDMIKQWNVPEDKKIILLPARFTAWKGHEFLIDSLAKIQNDFFCVMLGSDHGHKAFRKKIEQLIVKKNLAEKVRVIGLCKDMQTAYALAHFVVCSSVRPEAFGRVAIEAQASSKVIIATKIGGSLDTIIEGKTGFFVDVGDVQIFAELMDKLLTMPKSEIDEMGAAARQHVIENFSNEKMCEETLRVYRDSLYSVVDSHK
ncbi:MAG: glycosyltransferase family 4 protein [Alphaproteobacteria bacterium]|nr:glycosyltransferase family 4 protein [Alphaproteobacteria bacterium]